MSIFVIIDIIHNLKFNIINIENDIFSEGIMLYLGKQSIVEFGVVKPTVAKEFGIKQEVLYADFYWDNILATLSHL